MCKKEIAKILNMCNNRYDSKTVSEFIYFVGNYVKTI